MSNYSEKITNNERAVVLEDAYRNTTAKLIVPTITPSLPQDKPRRTRVNAPTPSNVVSGVNLSLTDYYNTNYIELQTITKLFQGDTVTVSTVNDLVVEKMSIVGEYYDR